MPRYLIIDASNNVINVVEWDGISQVFPPGTNLMRSDTGNIGDTIVGGLLISQSQASTRPDFRASTLTLNDVISVLTPAQQAQLQTILKNK